MSDQPIFFTLCQEATPEIQERILSDIRHWRETTAVARLKPDSNNARLRRMAYLYARSDADPAEILRRLRSMPEIESVSLPSVRHLAV